MSYSSMEVHPRQIAMTPDNSIVWEAHSTANGTLYKPPHSIITATLAHTLITGEGLDRSSPLGVSDNGGAAYPAPGALATSHAIREKARFSWLQSGGLPTLRATVMLERGLALLDQSAGAWRFRGVTAHGMYFSDSDLAERWLLERIDPVLQTNDTERLCPENTRLNSLKGVPTFPSNTAREDLYDAAIVAAHGGADVAPYYIFYDDTPENMLVEKLPEFNLGAIVVQGSVVKIDIDAQRGLDF